MKKLYKLGCFLLVSALMLTMFVGCGEKEKPQEASKFTVSFNSNGGSSVEAQKVESGKTASKPADPTKTDFYFQGWYTDAELSNSYDFGTAVTADITLYAGWVDASGSVTATFYTDETTEFTKAYFEDGGRIAKPDDPKKDGYYFAGWFTTDGTQYKQTAKFTGEQKFYAKWLKIYTFEAEKTQLTGLDPDEDDTATDLGGKRGQSYSGNVSGAALIGGCACGASGDAYVTNLYYNGAFIEFEITSDVATDEALLFLSLTAEFTTISLNKDTFLVTVNGTKINYEPITITGGTTDDLTATTRTAVKDYAMGNVSLVAGKNVVRLEVNNSDKQFATGTMDAAAPIIDAIKIYTQSGLTMKEYQNK